jgi:hypothetical protein
VRDDAPVTANDGTSSDRTRGVGLKMKLTPSRAFVAVQSAGVAFLLILTLSLAQVDLRQPISILPTVVLYLFTQAAFRLGLRQAERRRRLRNLLFIA